MTDEFLTVGTKIKIGKEYADNFGYEEGQIIELVEGYFDYENGLYTETQTCPAVFNESQNDFDSIYHLFGNDMEHWMDCEIVKRERNHSKQTTCSP